LIKKIEMLRNNENNNDFNIRKNLEQWKNSFIWFIF
jgi:hypothetical protein